MGMTYKDPLFIRLQRSTDTNGSPSGCFGRFAALRLGKFSDISTGDCDGRIELVSGCFSLSHP